MLNVIAVFYLIIGAGVALFQIFGSHEKIPDDVNFVDITFGVVSVVSFWPFFFLSIIVDDIKDWRRGK